QLSTDTILTAETTVEPDAQTAMLVKTFLRGTPKLWFGVEVKHDGTSEVNGHLEPIVTNPNPLFTLEMPKRATFRLTSDEEFLPTHMEFNVPSLLIGQNGGKSELSGLRLTTRGVVAGDKVTLKNKYAFKELKFQSKGRKPVVAGPLNLNLDLK